MPLEGVLRDSFLVSTHALHELHQDLASNRRTEGRDLPRVFLR